MDKGDNGKGKKIPQPPDVKDYVVLVNLQHKSLQITLDMYDQKEWELKACLYSESTLYTMIFRRRLNYEY